MEKKDGKGGEGERGGAAGAGARPTHTGRGAIPGFSRQGLWLPAPDRRGQCEAGLLGDVCPAGPVCLFFIFLAVDTSVVEKQEEVRGVAGIDNGPRAS